MAARIVCKHPLTDGYTLAVKTVADAQRAIESIEKRDRKRGGCEGPHTIEVWQDSQWVEVTSDGE